MRLIGIVSGLTVVLATSVAHASGWEGASDFGTLIGTEFIDFTIGNGELCAIHDQGDLSQTMGSTGCSWGDVATTDFSCVPFDGAFTPNTPCTCGQGVAEAITIGAIGANHHSKFYVASTNGWVYQFQYQTLFGSWVERWSLYAPFPSTLAPTTVNGCGPVSTSSFSVKKLVFQPTDGGGNVVNNLFMLGNDGHVYKLVPGSGGQAGGFVDWSAGSIPPNVVHLSFSAWYGAVLAQESDGSVYEWYDGWESGTAGWYPYSSHANVIATGGAFDALQNSNGFAVDFNFVTPSGSFPGFFNELENGWGDHIIDPGINSGFQQNSTLMQGQVLDIQEGGGLAHLIGSRAQGTWGGPVGADIVWVRMSGVNETGDGEIFVFHN